MWRPTIDASRFAELSGKPGFRDRVNSPQGTDPATCKKAFQVYLSTLILSRFAPVPVVQTDDLYRGSVGSFSIYGTLDKFDGKARTATINFWMYNSMSRKSFGQFSRDPMVIKARCGMQTQHMWWNWVESVGWGSGILRNISGWR